LNQPTKRYKTLIHEKDELINELRHINRSNRFKIDVLNQKVQILQHLLDARYRNIGKKSEQFTTEMNIFQQQQQRLKQGAVAAEHLSIGSNSISLSESGDHEYEYQPRHSTLPQHHIIQHVESELTDCSSSSQP
jgi:hypothetical protein